MSTHFGPSSRRRLAGVVAAISFALAVAACAPAAPAEGPGAVVTDALAKVAAKDVDGLRALACAGQADLIGDQLGIPGGVGGEVLPGLDAQAVVDAIRLDVTGVKLGEASIDGDTAQVPVTGTIKVTFDAATMRPLLRDVLEKQGASMTDEQLDSLLGTLETFGQDVPVDQSVRLLREDGAWKVCQDTIEVPAAS